MSHTSLQYFSVAICLAGLALSAGIARAEEGTGTPPQIDKSAGQVELAYPVDAQGRGEEGSIDFALNLNSRGRPTGKIKIMKSTGFADLDDAAIQSALRWHYVPARTADGRKAPAWIPLHLDFKLPQPPTGSAPSPKPAP